MRSWLFTLLLFCFSYQISDALEVDSLSLDYLKAKDEALSIIKEQADSVVFEQQVAHFLLVSERFDDVKQAALYIQMAKKYLKRGAVIDSLLNESEAKLRNSKCDRGLGEALFYVGVRAMQAEKVDVMHDAFQEAASSFRQANYLLGELFAYSRLANFYARSDNFELAERFNNQVLALIEDTDDTNLQEMVYLNVANFYMEQVQLDDAIKYYNLLEESIAASGNKKRLKPLYNNLGTLYYHKREWEKAKEYLTKSIAIKRDQKDSLGLFGSYQNLFRISLKTKHKTDATYYFEQLSDLDSKIDLPAEHRNAFNFNKVEYRILNDKPEQAIRDFYHFSSVKDSLYNAVFSDKLIALEETFEIEKRDQEIVVLQKEDALQKAKVRNLQISIILVIIFIVVLLINGFYMKRQWQQLIKADELLQLKQDEVLTVNKRLEASNQSKDRILSVIGHDLRGPLGGLKELVELYMELPELEPDDITNLLKNARASSTSAYYLLENLLTWANSQREGIRFNPILMPIVPIVQKVINILDQSINNRHIKFVVAIDSSLSLRIDIQMFRAVIRNLVSNAIKHSPDGGQITVSARSNELSTVFTVQDQGQGIVSDEVNHIFDKKEAYYIGSDMSAKGSGLGLILCKEFVERHGGAIWVSPDKEQGAEICFSMPTQPVVSVDKKQLKKELQEQ
ncbi:ATP-binding protein [Carboxylicivirga sp. M1479]|uniref:tetratricopeptide repeat-containing sensor histidine kinase n=1 Tax=Carboxylicivirga sp. M1479 TaxID=2594476 RepID=UPI00117735AC|nr:ATP-binding protein [Carboxylicivirga sp. M1479]TRX71483.1 tetratricopeptide repeat protein [Carboxylicivirga sp. M1479]